MTRELQREALTLSGRLDGEKARPLGTGAAVGGQALIIQPAEQHRLPGHPGMQTSAIMDFVATLRQGSMSIPSTDCER